MPFKKLAFSSLFKREEEKYFLVDIKKFFHLFFLLTFRWSGPISYHNSNVEKIQLGLPFCNLLQFLTHCANLYTMHPHSNSYFCFLHIPTYTIFCISFLKIYKQHGCYHAMHKLLFFKNLDSSHTHTGDRCYFLK